MTTDLDTVGRAPLTTGWEPADALAADDTVMRQFVLQLAESSASAALANGGRVERTADHVVADSLRPAGYYNSAVLTRPLDFERWRHTLTDIERCLGDGRGDAYLWSAWPTPDLTERGWEPVGHPPVLVRQAGGRVPDAVPGLRVERVRTPAQFHDWERVVVEGYPFDDLQPYRRGVLLSEEILADPRWSFWVGYDAERPVTIGGLFVSHGLAYLGLGVTLPESRGRGYWYAMVRERLLAQPDLVSGSMFSDLSRPGIQRLGYLPITRLTVWRRHRP